jgi:hypothetical protein
MFWARLDFYQFSVLKLRNRNTSFKAVALALAFCVRSLQKPVGQFLLRGTFDCGPLEGNVRYALLLRFLLWFSVFDMCNKLSLMASVIKN